MSHPQQAHQVITSHSGGEVIVYDPWRDIRFELDEVTALVWEACDGRTSPEKLAQLVREAFDMPDDVASEVMWFTLDYLEKVGLLQEDVTKGRHIFSRRQVLKILSAAGITLAIAPVVASNATASAADMAAETMVPVPANDTTTTTTTEQPPTTTTTTTATTRTPPTTTSTTTSTTSTTTTTPDPAAIVLNTLEGGPTRRSGFAGFLAAAAGLAAITWRKLTSHDSEESADN